MHDDRQRAWTRYWRSGALHSCVGSYDGNYGGAVAAFWRERFRGLGDESRVLDLATGNGPLPALLLDACGADAMPRVDAVDFAEPRPTWPVPERVRFHAGVAMEALPFDAASFDAVFSQFGFEYAERERATAELLRVSTPDARIVLVMHHAGSHLAKVAREQVAHIDWLLGESGVPDAVRAMLPLAERQDPALRARFNDAFAPLAARAEIATVPDALHGAGHSCAGIIRMATERGASAAAATLNEWQDALADERLRSAELCDVALDDRDVRGLAARLGAGTAVGELREGPYLLGWSLVREPG